MARPISKHGQPSAAKTDGHARQIKQEKLLAALRGGNTRTASCAYAGVHHDTLYEWLQDPLFSEKLAEAEAAPEIICASSIIAAAKRDWRAAEAWLKRRRSADWKEITGIEWGRLTIDQLVALAGAGEDGVDSAGDHAANAAAVAGPVSE